jgi:hypothetical protein
MSELEALELFQNFNVGVGILLIRCQNFMLEHLDVIQLSSMYLTKQFVLLTSLGHGQVDSQRGLTWMCVWFTWKHYWRSQIHWVSGLCSSSCILKAGKHNVMEFGSVFVQRRGEERRGEEWEASTLLGPVTETASVV